MGTADDMTDDVTHTHDTQTHMHDMGTADDMTDDVTHTHDTQTHMHDMGTADDMTDDVSHYHGEYGHTHGEEDMLNAPGHAHGFHTHVVGEVDSAENAETDDYMHYHLGGGFVDEHTHESVQAGPAVTLKGSSTLTFGMDLGTNATGFKNESAMDLKVTIIPEQTAERNSEGKRDETDDLYAHIKLENFKWEVTSADHSGKTSAPAITTSLFMGPFSLKTFTAPTIHIDYVDDDDADKAGATHPGLGYKDFAPDVDTTYHGSGGLTLGYEIDPVTLSLGVLSAQDWTDTVDDGSHDLDKMIVLSKCVDSTNAKGVPLETCEVGKAPKTKVNDQNDENAYAFIGTVGVDIGDSATLEFAVAYAHMYKDIPADELKNISSKQKSVDDIGLGAKATFELLDSDGDDDNDLTTTIAFDGQIPSGDSNIPWDVGGGVKWDLSPDDESSMEAELIMHAPADGSESTLGVRVTLKEGDGNDGALEGLGAELSVRLDDLTGDDATWTTKVAGSYAVEGIKPFFMVNFSNAEKAKTAFEAGVELKVIDYLTTTLMYASKDITGGTDKGQVTAALKIEY
jgi:hypothetical protein